MVALGLKGKKQQFELSLLTDVENLVWIELFIDPIIHPQNGEIHEVSCMAFEVTEKKEVAKSIKQSLKEKETLLQEVHHRVKNNLQIISSIMNLQSSYVKEEDTMNILMECQNRIKSMSFIHDSLYLNKDLGSVDFQFYIHGLCRNLVQSYSVDPSKIDLQLEIDNVDLSLDQAIPCGLIVNELVSNAMKYAFPEGKSGILKISVQEKAGRMMMEIKDNGVGVGDGIRLEDIESLGLQLVFTLIEQLDGEVEYSSHQGTKYLITFDRLKSRKLWQEPTYS
jgi:two-component sensor histidine kinase